MIMLNMNDSVKSLNLWQKYVYDMHIQDYIYICINIYIYISTWGLIFAKAYVCEPKGYCKLHSRQGPFG